MSQLEQSGACTNGLECDSERVKRKAPSSPSTKPKKKRRRKKSSKKPNAADPRAITAFFEQYPRFNYNSSEPVMSEFYRMCDALNWDRNDSERNNARDNLKDALVQQFNAIYGTNENDLAAWQNLCCVLNLNDIPNELEPCRKLVKSMYVNIVDLVDTPATQVPVIHFESEVALSRYTKATGKYFPKDNAYAGGLLKFLLRRIESPGEGKYTPRQRH